MLPPLISKTCSSIGKLLLEINPVLGHILAMAAPRGKELDEGQPLLDGRFKIIRVEGEVLGIDGRRRRKSQGDEEKEEGGQSCGTVHSAAIFLSRVFYSFLNQIKRCMYLGRVNMLFKKESPKILSENMPFYLLFNSILQRVH